jgi:hypothetical protein
MAVDKMLQYVSNSLKHVVKKINLLEIHILKCIYLPLSFNSYSRHVKNNTETLHIL